MNKIGINNGKLAEWEESPFLDIFRTMSQPIPGNITQSWDIGGIVQTDNNGYPNSLENGQGVHFSRYSIGIDPGDYYCLYDGTIGSLSYHNDIALVNKVSQGKDLVRIVNSSNSILIHLANAGAKGEDYIRNIRLIPVGSENTYLTQPFTQPYLGLLKGFDTIRSMDATLTNELGVNANWGANPATFSENILTWEKRARLDQVTWCAPDGRPNVSANLTPGLPIEILVSLSNILGSKLWVNIPTGADDEYITGLAKYIKDNLNPALKVYVEYSNETWNGGFNGEHLTEQLGIVDPAITSHPILTSGQFGTLGSSAYNFVAGALWSTRRSIEALAIFNNVFAGSDGVIGVLGAWAADASYAGQCLSYAKSVDGGLSNIKAVAIAPYFGDCLNGLTDDQILGMSYDQLAFTVNSELPNIYSRISNHIELLKKYPGIRLLGYEGGQTIIPTKGTLAYLTGFQKSPQMGKLYSNFLGQWDELTNGSLILPYNAYGEYGKWGMWGMRQKIDDPITPKEEAIRYYTSTPAVTPPAVTSPVVTSPVVTPPVTFIYVYLPTSEIPESLAKYAVNNIPYTQLAIPEDKIQ